MAPRKSKNDCKHDSVFELTMPGLVKSMLRRQGIDVFFSTWYAYAVSF